MKIFQFKNIDIQKIAYPIHKTGFTKLCFFITISFLKFVAPGLRSTKYTPLHGHQRQYLSSSVYLIECSSPLVCPSVCLYVCLFICHVLNNHHPSLYTVYMQNFTQGISATEKKQANKHKNKQTNNQVPKLSNKQTNDNVIR